MLTVSWGLRVWFAETGAELARPRACRMRGVQALRIGLVLLSCVGCSSSRSAARNAVGCPSMMIVQYVKRGGIQVFRRIPD